MNARAEAQEQEFLDAADPRRSIEAARKHYHAVLEMARAAARELGDHLRTKGIIPVTRYADNSFDGLGAALAAKGYRLINAFAWANTRLWLAAQMVCDMEELPDDGNAEGIVWEVAL